MIRPALAASLANTDRLIAAAREAAEAARVAVQQTAASLHILQVSKPPKSSQP